MDDPEIVRGLLYALVELYVVGEHALYAFQFGHQPCELAVEGNEIRFFDGSEYLGKHGCEVCTIYLHLLILT